MTSLMARHWFCATRDYHGRYNRDPKLALKEELSSCKAVGLLHHVMQLLVFTTGTKKSKERSFQPSGTGARVPATNTVLETNRATMLECNPSRDFVLFVLLHRSSQRGSCVCVCVCVCVRACVRVCVCVWCVCVLPVVTRVALESVRFFQMLSAFQVFLRECACNLGGLKPRMHHSRGD